MTRVAPARYLALPVRRPSRRLVSRRGRPFQRPCGKDPAGRCRKPSSYGRTLSSFGYPGLAHFPAYRSHALAKAPCNVVLRATIVRGGEDAGGLTKLDQLAEVHEGR